MGNFYTNVSLPGVHRSIVADVLRELGRTAIVVQDGPHCVVYDRESDDQDASVLAALAEHLSIRLKSLAFAVLNHDDSILWFQLYRGDELVAEYANVPQAPRTRVRALCETLGARSRFRVWWTLKRPYLFQVERHRRLTELLGLPSASVAAGFNYVSQGEIPDGIEPHHIERTGPQLPAS
jgi:hypothetical protein